MEKLLYQHSLFTSRPRPRDVAIEKEKTSGKYKVTAAGIGVVAYFGHYSDIPLRYREGMYDVEVK